VGGDGAGDRCGAGAAVTSANPLVILAQVVVFVLLPMLLMLEA
jgi:hypothetical protein